jgi:signal transduction histidine kinase
MKLKIAALVVTLVILAATYGIFFVYFSLTDKHTPKAENGFLDLAAWRFADDGVVPLDGEWEFYPGKLLSHEDFISSAAQETQDWIEVPGSWSKRMSTLGVATYRLQVKIGDAASVYGLKTTSIQMSNRIIVNGEIVGESGNPAEKRSFEAMNQPYAVYFTLKPGWNEIIVQVANYVFPASSGINEPIYLGYAAQISELRDKALSHDWITVTAFLIMGLYFIGLYSQRRNDKSLFVLGLVCLSFALFTSARGERVINEVFDNLPFWLFLRIQLFTAVGGGIVLFLYVYTAFRAFCSKWLIRIGIVAGIVLALWTLLLLPWFATNLYRQLVTIYVTFSMLHAIYVFVQATFRKVEGSLYLAIAAVALNVYVLVQNANVYFGVPVDLLPPFEPFVLLLMLALLMSLRFSNAFKKIEELSIQLLKADKLKDEFLARTSHEFKSPLHGVMLISRSMLEDRRHPLTSEQAEKLHLVIGIADRLSRLVYDILDFSKLKLGELTVDPIAVDVRSAVEMQVRIYSYLSEGNNTRLVNRVPDQLPYALADESRFSQIIGNLLDNAVKHTKNGNIVVSASARDGMIEVSVSDTGEGIDEHHLPHIFEAFQTFDDTKEHRGFGLGLPIVKKLVELQQGQISVSSTKGIGTTFTFTLPIAHSGLEGSRAAAASQTAVSVKTPEYAFETPCYMNQQGKHTILIVDDQFLNLRVLMDALAPLGYNVIAVKNGFEAIDQISKPNKIDLVVLDLMMPGLSGYEVCQEIRKSYTLPELPVLMVTAAISSQDKVAAFEAGANDFLPKPFDLAELKARIGSLLTLKDALAKAVDLEVAFLQSQIKPHFLYNVLNSIVGSSYTDVERSRKLTTDLAEYLRGSFRFSHMEKRISFKEEFSLIRTYVEIEKERFRERLHFEYDIAEGMYNVKIPPLLIQPLVENAIRHGIAQRIEGGRVKLTAYEAEGDYWFIIDDNGVGMESAVMNELLGFGHAERQGVGLLNINKRLKYEYGTELQLESEPGRGTKVTVRIPAAFGGAAWRGEQS